MMSNTTPTRSLVERDKQIAFIVTAFILLGNKILNNWNMLAQIAERVAVNCKIPGSNPTQFSA